MNKLSLFAIAAEYWYVEGRTKVGKTGITHVHAENAAQARFIYLQDVAHAKHRIVAIGPVIGYIAEDDNGDVVHA